MAVINNATNTQYTEHYVIVGAANNGVTSVTPSANVGWVLTSNGLAADPSFQAATGGTAALDYSLSFLLGGM